eukprot:gnl/Dysnectes_brevis/1994_a2295_2045.p1 GENE.gnl/Dysnectes_brevis/1994_a2295_2045~~gnl/Dysnectes_brevis/1994_a2295_2045.p1  ORF type:complete len:184 (+),score=78.21 gnl/Dysnectes_brevis/1994_a2295_2045:35-553(+)
MSSIIDLITKRRSVRQFTEGPVSDEQVHIMLEAAMAAPSAVRKDPWRFIVVRDQAKLAEIPTYMPYSKMVTTAPVTIIVCGEPAAAHDQSPLWMIQDVSAAVQNLLLAASAQGLGAVWTGAFPEEARMAGLRKTFGIPEDIIPVAVIPVGHPKKEPASRTRFNEELVHTETW